MSSSVCLSSPGWIASSGRWNSRYSQFSANLKLVAPPGFGSLTRLAGTTTEAVMSSSVWILAAAAKSWRTLYVRHAPPAISPTRRYVPTSVRLPIFSSCPGNPLMMSTPKCLRQSAPHPGR